jgi:voltage-gated potassium channel
MIGVALLVIPLIFIESSNPGEPLKSIGVALNWFTWLAFLVELVVMLWVSPRPLEWLRQRPLDAVVVVLSPPVLPFGLGAVRLLRLLRLVRLLRLFSLRRLLSLEGVRDAAALALLVVIGGGAAYAAVETDQHLSTWDGIWWAITTVTTVGYGGSPETTGGRVIAIVVMVTGISFVALLTAFIADRFIRQEVEDVEAEEATHEKLVLAKLERIEQRLERLDHDG